MIFLIINLTIGNKIMTDFAIYYRSKFRQDINQFFSTIPEQSKFHEDNQNKQTFTIQYERLTKDYDHLNFLTAEDKINFGLALFITILSDMVCYFYFRQYYDKFRQLTLYPKFIGNCPGGCKYHFHPSDIFSAMNYARTNTLDILSQERLDFYKKFNEAVLTMEKEITSFFIEHMTEIDVQAFWDRCYAEFPYKLKQT
jgi:hypothetical protein